MNIENKIILGLAQSDNNYGLFNKNRNLDKIHVVCKKYKINFVDTAPNYKNSDKILINFDDNIKVYSKFPIIRNYNQNLEIKTEKILNNIFNANNKKKIEGLLLHDPVLPLEHHWPKIYKILNSCKKKGLINKIGVSVYSISELEKILKVFKPDIIQYPLNIFNQEFYNSKILNDLKKKNVRLIARSIFLQGLLCNTKYSNNYFLPWREKLKNWFSYLKKNNLEPQKACLQFILSDKNFDQVILGVDNPDQLKNNLMTIKKINPKRIKPELINIFNDFATNDKNLTDPRFWYRKNISYNLKKWNEYKKNILNGSMLLSKKPDRFLPGAWPVNYSKAKGCYIWSNNKKYLDFCLMGVGTNILGYSNKYINKTVQKEMSLSNMSSFNSDKFNQLSLEFFKMHKWSNKAFFAKTGAEANAIALRISRNYSKKNSIVVCGYHGWQDWYLSANIKKNNSLDKIHLKGLSIEGVPCEFGNLIDSFYFNDLEGFERIIKNKNSIGTLIMEVQRNIKPKKNFLKKIRKICTQKKITLIFDECTSGFRECYGGLHKKYGVEPDIAVFGKALGNGIPINVIITKNEISKQAEKSFISSTFWSDSVGPAAALTTLKEMKKIKSWIKICKIGKRIKLFWKKISKKYNLNLDISGLDSMPTFNFKNLKNDLYINFITQEMLKKNILATNTIYCCVDHQRFLKKYFFELEKIFYKISLFEKNKNISLSLENPLQEKNFSRLN
jgi:glutamate-1-semialdehyde 2,1-aminomutase